MVTICQPAQQKAAWAPEAAWIGSNIVVCLCVFLYVVAKKPDPPIPDIKKPDQVQLTVIGLKLFLLFTKEQ